MNSLGAKRFAVFFHFVHNLARFRRDVRKSPSAKKLPTFSRKRGRFRASIILPPERPRRAGTPDKRPLLRQPGLAFLYVQGTRGLCVMTGVAAHEAGTQHRCCADTADISPREIRGHSPSDGLQAPCCCSWVLCPGSPSSDYPRKRPHFDCKPRFAFPPCPPTRSRIYNFSPTQVRFFDTERSGPAVGLTLLLRPPIPARLGLVPSL